MATSDETRAALEAALLKSQQQQQRERDQNRNRKDD